jgi:hypothetical protein
LRARNRKEIIGGIVAPINMPMPGMPLELPPAVARNFVRDMRAFFAEKNTVKADEIAARQAWALNQHLGPRDKPLRLIDVKEMFPAMRDHI